jgi:oligosaccharide repeat unit polymerase
MVLLIFLILLLALFYLVYETRGKDLFAPSVLLMSGYILTTVFAIYNVERWKTDVSIYMLFIVASGIITFAFTEQFVQRVRVKRKSPKNNFTDSCSDQLHSLARQNYTVLLWIAIAISLIATVFVYREMIRIAYSDFKAWGNVVYNYKINKASVSMSGVARVLQKITKAFAYIYAFIFANAVTEMEKIKIRDVLKRTIFLVPGIIYSVQQMFLGARIGVLALLIAVLFFIYYCGWKKWERRWTLNVKRFIQVVAAFVLVSVIFFQVRELVGRQQRTEGIVDYIATYVGGSFDLFSQYLRNPSQYRNSIEVFSGVVDNLQSYLGIMKGVPITTSHEFRNAVTGVSIGNTYTAFRSYYNDFGYLGVLGLSFLLAVIFGGVYYSLLRTKRLKKSSICILIIYAMQLYSVPFHFFTDYFFARIAVNMILDFAFVIIICGVVFKEKYLKLST